MRKLPEELIRLLSQKGLLEEDSFIDRKLNTIYI